MFRLIKPIKIAGQYQPQSQSDDSTPVVQFLQAKPIPDNDKIAEFTVRNPDQINNLLPWIPAPTLVDMMTDINYLSSIMSPELLQRNLKYSKDRSIINRDMSEFIKLNDRMNSVYCFATAKLKRRLRYLPNLNDFWIVGSSVLELASDGIKNPILVISKNQHIKRNDRNMFTGTDAFLIEAGDFHLRVDREYREDMFTLLFGNKVDIILDPITFDCYCTFDRYQTLVAGCCHKPVIEEFVPTKYVSFALKRFKPVFPDHRSCYVCKRQYPTDLFYKNYWAMCMDCGLTNYLKSIEHADLFKVKALVTGCRHKIGLATCLKLLRCGATVVGTTRFPNLALVNYQNEPDYQVWRDRLTILECDFVNIGQVERVIHYVATHPGFNCFINNACQTVRGSDYYLQTLRGLENGLIQFGLIEPSKPNTLAIQKELNEFKDITDVDLYKVSSWYKPLEHIGPREILEVTLINQIVPTLLFQQLKPMLQEPRFMIEVTAVEGQFYITKNDKHPHTNACKAAMNMLIHTLSQEPPTECKNQFVYAIDPGYVSGVNPATTKYPLAPIDGASRIIDPLIQFYNGKPLPRDYVHLKNYRKCNW
jgi:NAD(P)-dependent dehydrogenase (short-subunit alcohol dehydrogenase family)